MTATAINEHAPVISRGDIHIEAGPQTVWAVVSDIPNWPRWNPDVSAADLHGPLAPGGTFTWKAGPGTIRSTLLEVDAPHRIAWKGHTLGIDAIHTWRIEPDQQRGGVTLHTAESWEGLIVRLLRPILRRMLDAAVATGLDAVKVEAQRRPAGEADGAPEAEQDR